MREIGSLRRIYGKYTVVHENIRTLHLILCVSIAIVSLVPRVGRSVLVVHVVVHHVLSSSLPPPAAAATPAHCNVTPTPAPTLYARLRQLGLSEGGAVGVHTHLPNGDAAEGAELEEGCIW